MRKHRHQRGQVIPYVAFMILLLTGAALVVFDIGYMINARIKSQNAADAAALAAVAVKINKHHVDTLVRAAMSQESIIAQAEIRAAQAVAVQAYYHKDKLIEDNQGDVNLEDPAAFGNLITRYRTHANKAYKHAVKLHRERLAMEAWYKWLNANGPTAVREAARTAYAINMQGYDDRDDAVLKQNIDNVLAQNSDLLENKNDGPGNVGGFLYSGEGSSGEGNFGKSFVEFKTYANASKGGVALLKYLKQFELTSSAAAQLLRRSNSNPIGPLSFLDMNWYSPHLMAIDGSEDGPLKVLH